MKKFQERKQRMHKLNVALKKIYPNARIALRYGSRWEMLVAVILSAQTTDKKVNEVTPKLFKKYKTLAGYAQATPSEFAKDIAQIGLYKSKAKNIVTTARVIKNTYNGKIPDTIEKLTALPGVGRKTANVVMGNKKGIAVDTHVRRLVLKFDVTDHKEPEKIERDLMELLPKKEWPFFTCRMINYGREYCPARQHEKECKGHPLTRVWPKAARRWPRAR